MRRAATAAILLWSIAAHAAPDAELTAGDDDDESTIHHEVTVEAALGAGGDTTAPSGFATAEASFLVRLGRVAPPLWRRGLHLTDVEHPEVTLWILTGLDPEDTDEIGAAGNATIHGSPDANLSRSAFVSGRAWARAAGWQVEARGEIQPLGDLRDRFWRSGRGVVQTGFAVEIPGLWSIGTRTKQFVGMVWRVELGKRLALGDAGWHRIGFDRDISLTGMRFQTPGVTFDLLSGRYFELGVPEKMIGATSYGTSAGGIDVDVLAVAWRPAHDLSVAAHAGIAFRDPVAPYELVGTSESSTGPFATVPGYGVELRRGTALDPGVDGYTAALGAGSWTRLDPSGHAVDTGQLATASADWHQGRLRLGGALELGRLRRVLLGDLAPAGLAPVGTRMWMGRGTVLASLRVTRSLALSGTTWLERSDRDDPRWSVPASGALATHAGADLTARWSFRRL